MQDEFMNKLICGDNFEELKNIPAESVDLIYIDPPFFSNKQYEVVWGSDAEKRSFEDRWEGGINVYIDWMKQRTIELYRVLKSTGSFYLHCDWHAGHYLKVMCDEIFGDNFQNELIWYYQTGGATRVRYSRKHDNIFFYTKSNKWIFNSEEIQIKRTVKSIERAMNPKGARISSNDIYKNPDDVLIIPSMNPMARERLGYPTQKPEALLECIIKASSNKGDIILDAFCGCGTSCVVAHRLKRKWIGIDISPIAIKVIKNRLEKILAYEGKDYIIIGSPTTIDDLKSLNPFDFQTWIINSIHAKQSKKKVGDMGLDGTINGNVFRHAAGIQVKQSDNVGRNVIDNFRAALLRAKMNKGFIIAFSFTRGAHEESARLKNEGEIDIQLVNVEDLLFKKVKLI